MDMAECAVVKIGCAEPVYFTGNSPLRFSHCPLFPLFYGRASVAQAALQRNSSKFKWTVKYKTMSNTIVTSTDEFSKVFAFRHLINYAVEYVIWMMTEEENGHEEFSIDEDAH